MVNDLDKLNQLDRIEYLQGTRIISDMYNTKFITGFMVLIAFYIVGFFSSVINIFFFGWAIYFIIRTIKEIYKTQELLLLLNNRFFSVQPRRKK